MRHGTPLLRIALVIVTRGRSNTLLAAPDAIALESHLVECPGNADIQLDLTSC